MIKQIYVINYRDEELVLDLADPFKNGLILKNITGTGVESANVGMKEIATMDGAMFTSSRVSSRNLVLEFYLEGLTVEVQRRMLYQYFTPNRETRLRFVTDTGEYAIEGYVESNVPTIFAERASQQVSIKCPRPFFHTPEPVTHIYYGTERYFEFPFSNESITEPQLVLSEIFNVRQQTVWYNGDVETGIKAIMHALGDVGDITMYEQRSLDTMVISDAVIAQMTGHRLMAGDDIILDTRTGSKGLTLVREARTYNILNAITKTSSWLKLRHGDNIYVYQAQLGEDTLEFKIDTEELYEGI